MVLNVHRNHKAYQGRPQKPQGFSGTSTETTRLIRGGEKGEEGTEVGGRVIMIIYLSLHCHRQKDFCIKVGSDESHVNVS